MVGQINLIKMLGTVEGGDRKMQDEKILKSLSETWNL